MVSGEEQAEDAARHAVTSTLAGVTDRLRRGGFLGPGDRILLHLTGSGGGDYQLQGEGDKVHLAAPGEPPAAGPRVEITGDAEIICDIVNGRRDARRQFFEGGLQIRGDLGYFSEWAVALGILKRPI